MLLNPLPNVLFWMKYQMLDWTLLISKAIITLQIPAWIWIQMLQAMRLAIRQLSETRVYFSPYFTQF